MKPFCNRDARRSLPPFTKNLRRQAGAYFESEVVTTLGPLCGGRTGERATYPSNLRLYCLRIGAASILLSMNSTPSRYETIFGESAVAPSPGFDYDETAPIAPSGTVREYGVQIPQPDIYSYTGRPGVEYLVTAEYDEDAG